MLSRAQKILIKAISQILAFLFYLFCKLVYKFYCPLSVTGRENLPKCPYILCSNHNSHMDTPALMLATGLSFKKFGMIAAKDYFFANKIRKFFVNSFINLLPVDRAKSKGSLQEMICLCKEFTQDNPRNIIIYPEGTRSINNSMATFKRGSVVMAKALRLPLIPAYIQGTNKTLPKGKNFPFPGKIHVIIGLPIYLDHEAKGAEFIDRMTKKLQAEVKHLMGPSYAKR